MAWRREAGFKERVLANNPQIPLGKKIKIKIQLPTVPFPDREDSQGISG